MTIEELQAISEKCQTDAEFLGHLEVRRVWWKAIGHERFMHIWQLVCTHNNGDVWSCSKCHTAYIDQTSTPFECDVPDRIPWFLPEAVERLREKVVENGCVHEKADRLRRAANLVCSVGEWAWVGHIAHDTPRQRFLIFAATLGAVEVQ
jgi:hypothetical protein